MSLLGNLIWFIFGGLWMGLGWVLAGLLWCVTIVGIPIGMQCLKLEIGRCNVLCKVKVCGRLQGSG